MVTSSDTLRKLIHERLEKDKKESIIINDIYKFVESNCDFDDEDLIPPNLYGRPVKEPRWKRNVRNVLKSESDKNKITWKGRGLYSYYQLKSFDFESFDFDVVPKRTFFGLDKNNAHCFTIPKAYNLRLKKYYDLDKNKLQENINLILNKRKYPAIIRLVIMDRSKTRKLKKEDLPTREVIQLSWKSYKETQNIIKKEFNCSYDIISKGKLNDIEVAKFNITKEKNFQVSLIGKSPKIEQKKKIKSITCNIPSSFVNRNIKLANDRGNGEAKLYIGSVKDEEIFDQFFNNWHPLNNYSFDKKDLSLYFQNIESEFSKQHKYKNVSKKLYNKLMLEIEKIGDLRVDLSPHKDRKRYYIRGSNESWKLFRKIVIPLITRINVVDNSKTNSKLKDYKIKISKIGVDTIKLPILTRKIPREKNNPKKKKQVKRSRLIPEELKEKVWRRDRGMCQANFRIDSNLDKNTGDICGSNENLEFDHIVPFSKDGMTTYRNLQLLCQKHNRIKSDKDI